MLLLAHLFFFAGDYRQLSLLLLAISLALENATWLTGHEKDWRM